MPAMKILASLILMGIATVSFGDVPAATHAFLDKAAQGGITEIEAGKLAMARATTPDVKEFAEMVMKDHRQAYQLLQALAQSHQVSLPTTPRPEQRKALRKLQMKSGAAFEQAYVAAQIKAHKESIALLKAEIQRGQDIETKAFAKELLPAIETHLEEAYRLAGQGQRSASVLR
jgi:putative membrane protein